MSKCELDCKNPASEITYTFSYEDLDIEIPICLSHWREYGRDEDKFSEKYNDDFIDYFAREYDAPPMTKDEIYNEKVDQYMHEGR